MEFVKLGPEILEPPYFCLLAQLHTMNMFPTGKFGFRQTIFQVPNPQNVTWESNWCTYFTRLLTEWPDREISLNGPQPEYEAIYKEFVQKIVPEILEPFQSNGRSLNRALYTETYKKIILVLDLRLKHLSTLRPASCTHITRWSWLCSAMVIIALERPTFVNTSN